MKRMLFLLSLIVLLIISFFACTDSSSGETLSSSQNSSEMRPAFPGGLSPMRERLFRNADGKNGLLDENGNVIVEPAYNSAVAYENFALFGTENDRKVIISYSGEIMGEYDKVAKDTFAGEEVFYACDIDGTRKELDPVDDESLEIVEVENTIFYVLDSFGNQLFEEPFDDIAFGLSYDCARAELYAVRNGNYYEYVKNGSNWELFRESHKGKTGFEFFGYNEFIYHWSLGRCGAGLLDAEGNVVFEPIYTHVKMPFEDRVLLYSGDYVTGESICRIATLDGEKLAQFGDVGYTVFDDGSYVGIAFANVNAGNVAPDDEINYYYCFVDKDGNILSERFLSLDFRDEGEEYYKFYPESPDDTATAVTESGETVKISVEEYICEP